MLKLPIIEEDIEMSLDDDNLVECVIMMQYNTNSVRNVNGVPNANFIHNANFIRIEKEKNLRAKIG